MRARSCLLAIAFAADLGCAPKGATLRRDFEGDARSVRTPELQVMLRRISYEARNVLLHVEFHNVGAEPIQIETAGVLLAYQELELPPATDLGPPVPRAMEVPAGATREIWLAYVCGGLMRHDGDLVVRTVKRGGEYLPAVKLPIPSAPVANLDE